MAIRNTAKKHTDLATLPLLEKKEQWEHFGHRLPGSSILTIIPENDPRASPPLLKITQSYRKMGREAASQDLTVAPLLWYRIIDRVASGASR